ncbi:MAG: RNA polymerase sporulation sigma factor SigK [Oscillospiraceae bacterium]|nr:RNA polymerase sporulation sigma factor SigK [Oscillospiraceae bacterium]
MYSSLVLFALGNLVFLVLHLSGTGSFPKPLSAAEERECLLAVRRGDAAARNRLIEHNLRLVAHIIKKYYAASRDQEDLISIGTIGLIKAVSTFDCEKGTRFATYASRCVENEILMFFRSKRKSAGDVFISDPIDTDKDGNALTLLDVMSQEDDMLDRVDLQLRSEELHRCINSALDSRERQIINLRYGLRGQLPLTQREVAKLLHISRSYVSRLEKKALEKLKGSLSFDSY